MLRNESKFIWLTLFTSASTLICCALPVLFISLGAGASLAFLVGSFPFLITLSNHKLILFTIAGLMLLIGGWFLNKPQACPLDPELAKACETSKKISKFVFAASMLIYLAGLFFAFILPTVLN